MRKIITNFDIPMLGNQLTKDELISRQYKNLSTNYSDGMKFEGYDANGNIITRNGSTVNAVYDYGGDLSSITVTYKDKNGETNTVEDISIHDAKSTSKKLEYIGKKSYLCAMLNNKTY